MDTSERDDLQKISIGFNNIYLFIKDLQIKFDVDKNEESTDYALFVAYLCRKYILRILLGHQNDWNLITKHISVPNISLIKPVPILEAYKITIGVLMEIAHDMGNSIENEILDMLDGGDAYKSLDASLPPGTNQDHLFNQYYKELKGLNQII